MVYQSRCSYLDVAADYHNRFDSNLHRIFTSSDTGWNVHYIEMAHGVSKSLTIQHAGDLQDLAPAPRDSGSPHYFLIYQSGSWGRFNITAQGFQDILGTSEPFGPFLDLVTSFGLKQSSRDDDFGGLSHRFGGDIDTIDHYELCYNIRYVHRHGRADEYPWSFRQTAVYLQWNGSTSTSVWIFLQPPVKVKASLTSGSSGAHGNDVEKYFGQPLSSHLLLLYSTETSWRPFLADIEKEVETMNDKALYSHVGRPSKCDYAVTFQETQETQVLRQRLVKARSIIDTTMRITISLRQIYRKTTTNKDCSRQMLSELDNLLHRYHSHRGTVRRLLDTVDGTMALLLKVLEYRHDENIFRNVSGTRDLLTAAEHETNAMKEIAQKTQQDSRSMKIVTFIAVAYLPGTLVASIFSSSIVDAEAEKLFGFYPSRQLVSFLVVTSLLTILTLIVAVLWNRGYIRRRGTRAGIVNTVSP